MLEDLTKEEKRQKTRELKKGLDTDIYIITMVDNMIVMYSYIYFEVIRHFFKGGKFCNFRIIRRYWTWYSP